MSDFSIAEAKALFAQLVHQAESGQPVRITRRGRPVAVLVSESAYTQWTTPRRSLTDFTQSLRAEATSTGMALFDDAELSGLRDRSERPVPDLA